MTEQAELKMLRKKVKDLEEQLAVQERLIAVIKTIPSVNMRIKDETTVLGKLKKKGRGSAKRSSAEKPEVDGQIA